MSEQKQFLDFSGLQLYHQKITADITAVENDIPVFSVNDAEENLIITIRGDQASS